METVCNRKETPAKCHKAMTKQLRSGATYRPHSNTHKIKSSEEPVLLIGRPWEVGKDESAQWTRHDMSHGSMFSHVFSPGLLTRSATSSAKEAERSRTTFPRNAFEPGVSLCHTVSRCWSHSWTNTMACSRACGIATSEFGWGSGEIIPQKPYQHI